MAVQDDEEAAPAPRKIVQLQYNGWPDHGIPSSADSILGLIKASLGCQPDRQKPIIVHCRWAADATMREVAGAVAQSNAWTPPLLFLTALAAVARACSSPSRCATGSCKTSPTVRPKNGFSRCATQQ